MIEVSTWARNHRSAAIFFIVILKVVLFSLAIYAGWLLTASGWNLFPGIPAFGIVAVFIIVCIYDKCWHSYIKRKILDFSIAAISFISIAAFTNNLDNRTSYIPSVHAHSIVKDNKYPPSAKQILESLKTRDKSTLTRKEKRILRKEFNVQLKNYVVYTVKGDKANSDATFKIILTIIAAVGLLFLLSALVCNLSCSGADVAAVLVGVLGLTAIIWGTVAIIKSIKRKSAASQSPEN